MLISCYFIFYFIRKEIEGLRCVRVVVLEKVLVIISLIFKNVIMCFLKVYIIL